MVCGAIVQLRRPVPKIVSCRLEIGGREIDVPEFGFMLVADDFALSPSVSKGIVEALEAGRLSGAGAMTNRPFWTEGARDLRAAGLLARAGLHLNLTCAEPLTAMPRLAASGELPKLGVLLRGARKHGLPDSELRQEISAQLDAFTEHAGGPPAFVDGHQHVHVLPQIRDILFQELQARSWAGKVWLRDSADRPAAAVMRGVEIGKALFVGGIARRFRRLAEAAGFATNRGFSGFSAFDPMRDYGADFARYLRAPGEHHLVMCHPGYADDALAAVDPNTISRERELNFLLSPRFREVVSAAGAHLEPVSPGPASLR